MFKEIGLALISSSFLTLCPLSGYCMELEKRGDEKDLPPVKTVNRQSLGLSTLEQSIADPLTQSNISIHSEENISLKPSKWPKSYRGLIKKYSFDNPNDPAQKLPNFKAMPGKPLSEVKQEFEAKRLEYKNAAKYYERQPNDNALKINLELIQIWFLRKLAPVDKIRDLKKIFEQFIKKDFHHYIFQENILREILENNDYRKNNDISKLFSSEIEAIRKFIHKIPVLNNLSRSDSEPQKISLCIEPDELKASINNVKRLIASFMREHTIQCRVKLDYDEKYISEVTGYGTDKWYNWYYDKHRNDMQVRIKGDIEEQYPYSPYKLRVAPLIGNTDVESNVLAVYLKDDTLYFKVKDKDAFKIERAVKTQTFGLKNSIYQDVISIFNYEKSLTPKIESTLLNFSSLCGYLPENFHAQETLRWISTQHKLRYRLLNYTKWYFLDSERNWIRTIPIDITKVKPKDLDPPSEREILAVEELGNALHKPGNRASKKSFDEVWKNDIETTKSYIDLSKTTTTADLSGWVTYNELYPHRKKMMYVLLDLQEKQNEVLESQDTPKLTLYKNYNKKDFEEYTKLYNELESLLKTHLPFQKECDTYATRTIDGYFSAYQTESYVTEEIDDEINLSNLELKDGNFFIDDVEKPHPLDKVQKINLSSNKISGVGFIVFPEESSLKELYIAHNNLLSLECIKNLNNLEILDASHNSLNNQNTTNLNYIVERTSLIDLNLSHNDLKLEKDYSRFELARLNTLAVLDLSHNQFEWIDFLSKLINLTKLNISHNQISTLAPLSPLTSLTHLNISHNKIPGVVTQYFPSPDSKPMTLGLPNLKILDLSANKGLKFAPSADPLRDIHYKKYMPHILELKTPEGNRFSWDEEEI